MNDMEKMGIIDKYNLGYEPNFMRWHGVFSRGTFFISDEEFTNKSLEEIESLIGEYTQKNS